MLWVDKYRPTSFDKFLIHQEIAHNLHKLVASGDFPHTLFYGPSGAGKKTMVMALLREIYGQGVEKIKVETRPWKIELPSRTLEVEMTTVASAHHLELNPSDVGSSDRYVVQEIIKDMARNRPLDTATGARGFKVLVLTEVHRLSREAQQSLRRTMEKYSAGCRIVMCCSNVSQVMEPLRSRCLCVRVPAPTNDQVLQVVGHVAELEGVEVPGQLAARVAAGSGRNLRKALLTLEVCKVQAAGGPLRGDQAVVRADWELYIAEVAGDLMAEQTPKRLLAVRGKLYELLANCIPPELIFRHLVLELLLRLDEELKAEVVALGAQYQHRLVEGQKAIFHLEAFAAKFMAAYKKWALAMFA